MVNIFMGFTDHMNDRATMDLGVDRGDPYYESMSLNPNLSSHSSKRFAVNTADMNPFVRFTWATLRAGWIMKAFHAYI
jgi:hypothetical protein